MLVATILPQFIEDRLGWFLAGIILLLGLALGWREWVRLSVKRIWAISGVCFTEALRKRVLWVTPLAILGAIVVSQLQRSIDEQDAIRQTIKVSLFATALVVAVTSIILACANLPREIENRVIFTVVTKPTTRLEIVLGKIVGFARVSLVILLIMGAFTYAYLNVRAWTMHRYIDERLASGTLPAHQLEPLGEYREQRLLSAKSLHRPAAVQVLARPPHQTLPRKYFGGGGEGGFYIPIELSAAQLVPPGIPDAPPGATGIMVELRVGYERPHDEPEPVEQVERPGGGPLPYYGPFIISPEERQRIMSRARPRAHPAVFIEVLDPYHNQLGTANDPVTDRPVELPIPGQINEVRAIIPPNVATAMAGQRLLLRVVGFEQEAQYFIEDDPVSLRVAGPAGAVELDFLPGRPVPPPVFEGRMSRFGQQLRGARDGKGPVGVLTFRNVPDAVVGDVATLELRMGIERSGAEVDDEVDEPTRVVMRVFNRETRSLSDEIVVTPDSNRPVLVKVPAAAVRGGNFDVLVQCHTPGHHPGLDRDAVSLVMGRQSFLGNLCRSLLILWLMSILVVTAGVFCSTFLSWPIAVVLTLLILLGHWGVMQLEDALAPGIGNQVVADLGFAQAAPARAVSEVVELVSGMLRFMASIFPDISQFAAVEDIERGVTIPAVKIGSAAGVSFGFGIPLAVLAFVVFKQKEVAP